MKERATASKKVKKSRLKMKKKRAVKKETESDIVETGTSIVEKDCDEEGLSGEEGTSGGWKGSPQRMESDDDEVLDEPENHQTQNEKIDSPGSSKRGKTRPGIIYMSTIPYFMTARRLREILSQYGEMGRIFMKRETRVGQDGKRRKEYTEAQKIPGWIEFLDKRIAKRVALCCNNSPVGGKRRAKYKEALWNLKYLHRFQWMHLDEQLRYEKEVRKQRMRTEIAQAKREASFFSQQVEKGQNLKRLEETVLKKGGLWEKFQRQIPQKKGANKRKSEDTDDNNALLDLILGE